MNSSIPIDYEGYSSGIYAFDKFLAILFDFE